jgi:Flp pilus assembly protein TadG
MVQRVAVTVREERGQAMVEFALLAPIIIVLIAGILEFAKAFNYWEQTSQIAADTARWVVVNQLPAYTDANGNAQPAVIGPTKTQYRSFAFAQLVTKDLRDNTPNACTDTSLCGVQFCFSPPAGGTGDPPPTRGWAVTVNLRTLYKPLAVATSSFFTGPQITLKGSAAMRIESPPTTTLASDPGCP